MSENDVRPNAMAKYMERRDRSFAATSNAARRVKIEENHTWRIRMLPVQLGPDKEPFVDIAEHWWNKKPMTCPKHTGEAWGGNPDASCSICDVSERLQNSSSKEINDIGFKVRVNLKVRGYVVVFEMEDQKGNVDEMPISEVLNPYEFDMYKTPWERFSKFQKWATSGRRGAVVASEWGIMDLESGCDLLVTQTSKGLIMDRCDPSPIFPTDDPNFDNYIKKIWAQIRAPRITIPKEDDLIATAMKIEEYAETGGKPRNRGRGEDDSRGRGDRGDRGGRGRYDRGGNDEDNDDVDDGGGAYAARGSSREGGRLSQRRSAYTGDAEQEAEPQGHRPVHKGSVNGAGNQPPVRQAGQVMSSNVPAATAAAPVPPTRRAAAAAPAPVQKYAELDAPLTNEDLDNDQNPDAAVPVPPPPTRRGTPAAPPSARRALEPAQEQDADPEQAPEPPQDADPEQAPEPPQAAATPQRRATAPATPPQTGVDEEEDMAPEEARDQAPAVRAQIDDEIPPAVAATAPPARRAVVQETSTISSRLARLTAKNK